MIGHRLITKQTSAEGRPCSKVPPLPKPAGHMCTLRLSVACRLQVLVTERLFLRREAYFAILMDRAYEGPVMVARCARRRVSHVAARPNALSPCPARSRSARSPAGGMDIEEVARRTPERIFKEPVDIHQGPQPQQLERLASAMGFVSPKTKAAAMEASRARPRSAKPSPPPRARDWRARSADGYGNGRTWLACSSCSSSATAACWRSTPSRRRTITLARAALACVRPCGKLTCLSSLHSRLPGRQAELRR
jgi:hypothetical protein